MALFCGPEAFLHGPFLRSGGFPARPFSAIRAARYERPRIAPPHRGRAAAAGSRLRLPSAAPAFRPAYCSRFSRKMFRWASSGLRRSSSTNSTSSSTSATASR